MALRADGQFAAVTNQRALDTPPPGLRSRGLAVLECAAAADQTAYVEALDPTHYASMNLVFGNAREVSIAYLRREGTHELVRLGRGLHILCNDVLGAAGFPRGERLRGLIEAALSQTRSWDTLWPLLARALGDRTLSDDVPPSHLPYSIAHAMTSICIATEQYGTRSASLVSLEPGRIAAYRTADGPPDRTPFEDRMSLFA